MHIKRHLTFFFLSFCLLSSKGSGKFVDVCDKLASFVVATTSADTL